MKAILCFGDSNTYGYDPVTGSRFSRDARWPGVVRNELGEGYEIIEEGQGSRTTIWNDPLWGYKNGKDYLIPCLESHSPLDMVVVMLGTNDLKRYFALSPSEIAGGAGVLIEIIQRSMTSPVGGAPKVLLLSPPPIGRLTEYKTLYEGAEIKSRRLTEHYRHIAKVYSCAFLDTSSIVVPSEIDGVHLDQSEHLKLGRAVARCIRELLAPPPQETTPDSLYR